MDKLKIYGERKLDGQCKIISSKNAYLPILAATILTDKEVILNACPYFSDIESMCDILKGLGGRVEKDGDALIINNENMNLYEIPTDLAHKVRSSIFALGAILGRHRKAKIAYPGGCDIGTRPIDLHIKALKALGVSIVDRHGYLYCDAQKLKGGTFELDFPSVGATENFMMAAVLAEGESRLYHPAKEPEIVDLQNFLNAMGANITGAGGDIIVVHGVKKVHGCDYTPIPDRIVAGTYMIGACMTGGKIELSNACDVHLFSLLSKLEKCACKITRKGDRIFLKANARPKCITKIETSPYPGFPTDLQPQMMALECIGSGSGLMIENLFESRFKHVPELIKMGAKITIKDRCAYIEGVERLYGADVLAMDLRGGAALVLAGLAGVGYTIVSGVQHIDRGYDHIENDIRALGGDIMRISEKN